MATYQLQSLQLHSLCLSCDESGLKDFLRHLTTHGGSRTSFLDIINSKDNDGRTGLIHAARLGHVGCIKTLIDHGADMQYNNPISFGYGLQDITNQGTALHEAAIRGHEDCVSLLLSCGANPFLCNTFGATAFDCATMNSKAPESMLQAFKELALCCVDLEAKCCMHVGSYSYPTYKACQAVVTPCLVDNRQMKRVYLFQGGCRKAKAVISYEAGEASITGREINLVVRDPEGAAVHQPSEQAMQTSQRMAAIGGAVSWSVLSVAGPVLIYGAQALYTSSSKHFMLMCDGRKGYDMLWSRDLRSSRRCSRRQQRIELMRSQVPPPLHTTVCFSAKSIPEAQLGTFMRSLGGPSNAHMWQTPQQEILYSHSASMERSLRAAGEPLKILPSVPSHVKQRTHEQICVVCLNEPCNLGLLHEDSMHVCLCSDCAHITARGKPCPICRQSVEGIAYVKA